MKIKQIAQKVFLKLLYKNKIPSFIENRLIRNFILRDINNISPFSEHSREFYLEKNTKKLELEDLSFNKNFRSFLKISNNVKEMWLNNLVYKNINSLFEEKEFLDHMIEREDFECLTEYIKTNPILQPYFNQHYFNYKLEFGKPVDYSLFKNTGLYKETDTTDDEGNVRSSKVLYENYIDSFLKHINIESFFKKEKAKILKKIYDDSKAISDALAPLKQLNISYTIDLTGGCVRDFVLNKHEEIKDLDIMISIDGNHIYTQEEYILQKNIFTKEELEFVRWADNDKPSIKKINLIKLCFYKAKCLEKVYAITERMHEVGKDEYDFPITKPDRLLAVIKLNNEKINYPIDILLTDFSKFDFLKDFDLDICKASICIKNHYMDLDTPPHYAYLLSRFNATHDFWHDVINKTITYNTNNRNIKDFISSYGDPNNEEKFKNSHLNRLKNKYPDYTFLLGDVNSYFYEDILKFIRESKVTVLYNKIKSSNSTKDENKTVKKRLKI